MTRGEGRVVHIAKAVPEKADTAVRYELDREAGDDSAMFGIDETSGAVWFVTAPDHEVKDSYVFTVIADAGGLKATRQVTVNITDINDTAPVFAGGRTMAARVDEGKAATGYVAGLSAWDDAATKTSWRLSGDDAHLFRIDQASGALSFLTPPDYEAPGDADRDNRYEVTVRAVTKDDAGNIRSATQAVTVTVDDVNEDPTLELNGLIDGNRLAENTSVRTPLAQLTVTDPDSKNPAFRKNVLKKMKQDDSRFFEIKDGALYLKAGVKLDFETPRDADGDNRYEVTVGIVGYGNNEDLKRTFTFTVTDVNEAPTALRINGLIEGDGIAETATSERTALARLTVTDPDTRNPAFRKHEFMLSDPARFEIEGDILYLKAGVELDHEASYSHRVTVWVDGHGAVKRDFTLNVIDVNEAPTELRLDKKQKKLSENIDTTGRTELARITIKDPDDRGAFPGNEPVLLSGSDLFVIVDGILYLKAGAVLDYETASSHRVKIGIKGYGQDDKNLVRTFTLRVSDADDAPTDLIFEAEHEDGLAENVDTGQLIRIAKIDIIDPDSRIGFRDNKLLLLSGSDMFVIKDDVLYLKAGAVLNHEAAPSHSVTVGVVGHEEVRKTFTLRLQDVNDNPTVIDRSQNPLITVMDDTHGKFYTPVLKNKDGAVAETSWRLSGPDAHLFRIDAGTGAVEFKHVAYEHNPRDADGNGRYEIVLTVITTDGLGHNQADNLPLTIDVKAQPKPGPLGEGDIGPRHMNQHIIALIPENMDGVFYRLLYGISYAPGEARTKKVTFSLRGEDADLFTIDPDAGTLAFKTPPDYEALPPPRPWTHSDSFVKSRFGLPLPPDSLKGHYNLQIVMTANWDASNYSVQYVTVKVLDVPEQPSAIVTSNPGFYILATDRTVRSDTGYRVTVTDEKGDNVTVRMKDNPRFRIEDDGEIWIKKGQTFGRDGETEVTLYLQTRDETTDAKYQTFQKITIPIRQMVEGILAVTGDPPPVIDSRVAVNDDAGQRGKADVIYTAKATFKTGYEAPVTWSLGGQDAGLLGIDASTGEIWFRSAPKPEHTYKFTVTATALNGQIRSDETEITITTGKDAGIKSQGSSLGTPPQPEDPDGNVPPDDRNKPPDDVRKPPDTQGLVSDPIDSNDFETLTKDLPPAASPDII